MRAVLDPKDQAGLLHHRSPAKAKVSSPSSTQEAHAQVEAEAQTQTNRSNMHENNNHENNNERSKKRERECDFYHNPTLTSRLILHQKYVAAIRRIQHYPSEGSVWVCVKRSSKQQQTSTPTLRAKSKSKDRKSKKDGDTAATSKEHSSHEDHDNDEYSMRQLPLHMACQDLARVGIQASNRPQLEELIAHLVLCYPSACSEQDHNGSFPLHEAIWYTASSETISHLLCGAPDVAYANDPYGRSCMYLSHHCRSRTPEDQQRVQVMLQRGVPFWETALQEARLRLRHRNVPAKSASISSMSVLAAAGRDDHDHEEDGAGKDGYDDDATIRTTNEHACSDDKMNENKNNTDTNDNDNATQASLAPWSWSQLEQRAQRLEHLLAESLEKYFQVSVAKSVLEATHSELEQKYRLLAADTGNEQLSQMEQENAQLKREKQQLEELLQRHNLVFDDEGTMHSKPMEVSVLRKDDISMPKDVNVAAAAAAGMITSLEEDKRKLEIQVDELTRQNTDYERKVLYFEKVLDALSEEDSLTITSAATGLEHLTMSEPVLGHGKADNASSNNEDDILNGHDQMSRETLSSDPVDAWTPNQLYPSYSDSQEDDAFGALLRDTFQAYNDSKAGDPPVAIGDLLRETFQTYNKAGDPVASMENVEHNMYPSHERMFHSAGGEINSETGGLNDLFTEAAAAALYDT
jgi:hypothetical protein